MQSLNASPFLFHPHNSFSDLNTLHFPSVFFIRRRAMQQLYALNLVGCSYSFKKGNCYKGQYWGYSVFLRRCRDWYCEGDFSLEGEILEFMKNSNNPKSFPTKKELIDSGRMDLVDAITKKGGWLVLGWDLDEDEENEEGPVEVHVKDEDLLTKNESDVKHESRKIESDAILGSGRFFPSDNYSQPALSPGRSVETAEQSGIEGILNRLEKERNSILGLGFRHTEDNVSPGDSEDKDESHHRSTINSVAAELDKSTMPTLVSPNSSPFGGSSKLDQHRSLAGNHDSRNSLKPDMWRSWVIQRNGSSFENFEDAEIASSATCQGARANVSGNDILEIRQFAATPINEEGDSSPLGEKANCKEIKSRIQQLEAELSSVLQSLRSGVDKIGIQRGWKSSSDDLHKLSDAWEFQENEIFNAKDRLRSIRAKLAVLEGKMTLEIMDANKIIEEKQKRIDNAGRALKFLKTTCVVWPNSASEVLLAGSFDGWSSKREMEKSNTGVFSVYLHLYPGKYEIKFIVDGEWKIDPLRPIVHSNGYENNLLIIQE